MKKVLFIINPRAGQMRANKKLVDIISVFSSEGYECTVHVTSKSNEAKEICVHRAASFDLVVCIGGDGTLNEVVSGLIEIDKKIPVGYIPAGSTNDFASSLEISKDVVQAAKNIVGGTAREIDVCSFNGRSFLYIASFGAFTMASYKTPQNTKNLLGHMAYVLEGIREIPSIKSIHAKIETVDRTFEGDYVFGAISNSTSVGGLLTLDSNLVDMSDGLFEVMIIKTPKTPIELSQIITALNSSKYDNCNSIVFCSSPYAKVTCEKDLSWTLDGEYQKGETTNEFKILDHAVKFVLN